MKSVLILKLSDLNSAPRVLRTFKSLEKHFCITTAGYTPLGIAGEKFINLAVFSNTKESEINFHFSYPLPIRKVFSFLIKMFIQKGYNQSAYLNAKYWTKKNRKICDLLAQGKYDIIIVHGIDALPIAYTLVKLNNAKLVFNAHEYYPREFEDNPSWVLYNQPLYSYLCKTYLPKVDLFFSVTEGISREYSINYKVKPVTITNAAPYYKLIPYSDYNKIRIIHHGAALRNRKIENMIECVKLLDERFTFDLMLVPHEQDYFEELKELLSNEKRIQLIPPVSFDQIVNRINQYHIGLYILPKTNFNNEMALPNKFFEFIQARLMLAISPNHEMAALVKKYNIGIVNEDYSYEGLAHKLNKLTVEQIRTYQKNSDLCAAEVSAEKNAQIMLNSLKSL